MKRFAALCLCAALCAALGGCASRGEAQPASSSSSAPVSSAASAPAESAPPEEASSSQPQQEAEETYPLPELSDADLQLLLNQINVFAAAFPDQEQAGTPQDLPSEQALQFCMQLANRQKDLYGYYFEEQEGNYLIPAAVVAETAQRTLGLEGFTATDSTLYDPDRACYRYPLVEADSPRYALASPQGTAEGGISYEVEYLDEAGQPSHATRFTFRLGRLNGMPYLQLQAWEPVE